MAVDFRTTLPDAGQAYSVGDVDLADPAGCARLLRTLTDRGVDTLHGLVNVAGGFTWETLADGSWDAWERMYRINLQSAHHVIFNALPLLRRGRASIVNVGAAASARAGAGMGAYTASKSAVARLTESLAAEEAAAGIRANAVLPSIIDTPQNRTDMPDADFTRWVTPAELAEVIAFLLSPAASGVSGACIPVTGRVF